MKNLIYLRIHQPSTALISEIATQVSTSTTKLVHLWHVAGSLCYLCTNCVVLVRTQSEILQTRAVLD